MVVTTSYRISSNRNKNRSSPKLKVVKIKHCRVVTIWYRSSCKRKKNRNWKLTKLEVFATKLWSFHNRSQNLSERRSDTRGCRFWTKELSRLKLEVTTGKDFATEFEGITRHSLNFRSYFQQIRIQICYSFLLSVTKKLRNTLLRAYTEENITALHYPRDFLQKLWE